MTATPTGARAVFIAALVRFFSLADTASVEHSLVLLAAGDVGKCLAVPSYV
jgi:hypothetical protein